MLEEEWAWTGSVVIIEQKHHQSSQTKEDRPNILAKQCMTELERRKPRGETAVLLEVQARAISA